MSRNFNKPDAHTQSWYVAYRSGALHTGAAHTISLLGRKITLYRGESGTVHALDARCPHLGADLGKGKVLKEDIQCAFHHWCITSDGKAFEKPYETSERSCRSYPVQERWGLIWIWNGSKSLFDLPNISSDLRVLRMPQQTLRCHPHVMIANGLDVRHFPALHGMVLESSSLSVEPPWNVKVSLRGYPASRAMKILTGVGRKKIEASFETIGSNMAVARVTSPVRFAMLFTGNVTPEGYCRTTTIAFLPRKIFPDFFRALISIYMLLHDDRRILDDIEFQPAFTDADESLKKFVETVNSMATW